MPERLELFVKIIDSDSGIIIRVAIMFFLCGLSWFMIAGDMRASIISKPVIIAQVDETRLKDLELAYNSDKVGIEHRFSTLETKMDAVKESQDSAQTIKWIELFMLSGLLGEKGIQIVKSRISK
jgi:hypothetical protein